jgi:hypothetical protein
MRHPRAATITVTGSLDVPRLLCRLKRAETPSRKPAPSDGRRRSEIRLFGGHAAGSADRLCRRDVVRRGHCDSIPIASGTIIAEGDLDFRGTLGLTRTPIGFTAIRLQIDLKTTAENRNSPSSHN